MWKRIALPYRLLMSVAAEGAGGAGGGGAAPVDPGVDPAAAPAAGADPASPPEAKPQNGAPASLLKAGEKAGDQPTTDYIPEKFRVNKEDGTFDIEASARKLAENYGHLEKRAGTGDLPPKDASEYKITVPEAMGDYKPTEDPAMNEFLGAAQKAGMTQAQIDVVMDGYFKVAPQLAGAGAAVTQEQATAALKEVWKTDGDYARNAGLAYQATSAAVERAGVTMDEVEKAGLGNNPVFIRLMAGLGAEFQEDKAPGSAQFAHVSANDIKTLEAHPAYGDPKHPEHEAVNAKIRAYYARKHGTEAVG